MRRRIHIEFLGREKAVFTNYLHQKTIDLSKVSYLDLISLKAHESDGWDGEEFSASVVNGTVVIYAKNGHGGEWRKIGEAQVGEFTYFFHNRFTSDYDTKTEQTNEGVFEVTIV
jgi:hypothetical protein